MELERNPLNSEGNFVGFNWVETGVVNPKIPKIRNVKYLIRFS